MPELLNIKEFSLKNGKSKRLQLQDFERYFEYEKSGQKIIITQIYDTPKPKIDNRQNGNNSIYVGCIELILMHFLSNTHENTYAMTKKHWWKLLGMVNTNYGEISSKQMQDNYPVVTPFEFDNFYFRSNRNLEKILFSALNSLKNRRLIDWVQETVIVTDKRDYAWHIASEKELKIILDTERYVLDEIFGFEKMVQVFCRSKQQEFYQQVNAILNEKMGWQFYYKQIKLIFNKSNIVKTIPRVEANLQKKILNNQIIERMNTDANSTYNKWLENYDEQTHGVFQTNTTWRPPNTYLLAQEILTEQFIKIDETPDENLLVAQAEMNISQADGI